MPRTRSAEEILRRLIRINNAERVDALTHVERVPARPADYADWPSWAEPRLVARLRECGVERLWTHQAEAAQALHDGEHVVLGTGTASGKSLGYLVPLLSALLEAPPTGRSGPTALYLAPTKALAADQDRRIRELRLPLPPVARVDGDTTGPERRWIREHGAMLLTNPDLLHYTLLPDHRRWASFLKRLSYVVVDECHGYRGVLGSHVSAVLRRLRRICEHYGSAPVFALASATTADPAGTAARLTGLQVRAVTRDGSPRGEVRFGLWEPPFTDRRTERGAPVRRSATVEAAELLADLVRDEVRTVAFVRSRRGAELVSLLARERLGEAAAAESAGGVESAAGTSNGSRAQARGSRIAAYRAGYLAEERRALEADLKSGRLCGVAATNALELGVDLVGLDAVLLTGYPGTRASMWQQAGRAGRDGSQALAILIARDDPLDTYLVHHPEALFGRSVESTVLDPDNPHVLWRHLCAAAAELPLTGPGLELFGAGARELAGHLAQAGWLRERPGGWYWTRPERAADLADLRGTGGGTTRIVEADTGRLLGQVDSAAAPGTVHTGAVYLHQGVSYLVEDLDLAAGVAVVRDFDPGYTTHARSLSELRVVQEESSEDWGGGVRLAYGAVDVTEQVVGYLRRDAVTGAALGEEPLDLPARTLSTKAVWWTVEDATLRWCGITAADVPGAAHAAEHAAIGLLPLFAECDRWDVGGLSTALHGDTGMCTIFVHDGQQGGGGFAQRGHRQARAWLAATRDAIAACSCPSGCPSCVHSPKCGNGNHPLDKSGAIRLLGVLLGDVAGVPAQ